MTARKLQVSARKRPVQARAVELVATILEAAVQVLAREGAQRFTTARVAAKAGVSVGSLYQYFPNKASILFRLQSDEWHRTSHLLRGILEARTVPPLDRLRTLVREFIRSECDEARVRIALSDAEPLYRNAPEARTAKESAAAAFHAFFVELLPHATPATRELAERLITTTMQEGGKRFSEVPRTPVEIDAFGNAMADMFGAYLEQLAGRRGGKQPGRSRPG